MELLISFYDNALIYYPNVFFAILFLIGLLGCFFLIKASIYLGKGMIFLSREVQRISKEIKNDLKQVKRKEGKRMSFVPMVRVFFERKKLSLVYIIRVLTISFVHMIRVTFIRINTALGYIESQTEKIIKKIGREILIEE